MGTRTEWMQADGVARADIVDSETFADDYGSTPDDVAVVLDGATLVAVEGSREELAAAFRAVADRLERFGKD